MFPTCSDLVFLENADVTKRLLRATECCERTGLSVVTPFKILIFFQPGSPENKENQQYDYYDYAYTVNSYYKRYD